ncbi:MAG: exodeoxyribonuclease III [Pyrinomonadaceae bacterium]
MKIATWNVNSIAARMPVVLRWTESAKPDVLCLQEIKCTDDKFPADSFKLLGYEPIIFGQKTYNGVAILTRTPASDVQRGFHDDDETSHARLLAATIGGIRVVNVYIPNGHAVGDEKYLFKLDWLKRLRKFFDASGKADQPVLICGDFNVAPEDRDVYDPAAWEGKILCSEPERTALEKVRQWGFADSFRMFNEAPGQYSWWDYRAGGFQRNQGLRIDHIWITPALAPWCTNSYIDKEPREWERPSDHTPVVAEFGA